VLAGLAIMSLPAIAVAYCSGDGIHHEVDLGEVTIDADAEIGARLLLRSVQTTNNRGVRTCETGQTRTFRYRGNGQQPSANTYRTNIAGIGYRFEYGWWFPYERDYRIVNASVPAEPGGVPIRIELIKIGPISNEGPLTGIIATEAVNVVTRTFTWAAGSSVRLTNPSCTFTVNGGRDVDLLRHNASIFAGVGSTSPAVPFNITSTGCNAATTRVHLSWRGTPDPNDNQTFQITSGQMRGVGVLIERTIDGETVVPNGTRHSFDPLPSGEHYAYQARFRQTADTVTEGIGNTAVTINIDYN